MKNYVFQRMLCNFFLFPFYDFCITYKLQLGLASSIQSGKNPRRNNEKNRPGEIDFFHYWKKKMEDTVFFNNLLHMLQDIFEMY